MGGNLFAIRRWPDRSAPLALALALVAVVGLAGWVLAAAPTHFLKVW